MATKKPVKRIKLDSKKSSSTSKKQVKSTRKSADSEVSNTRRLSTPRAVKIAISPLTLFIGYVKGSWNELQMVRWPDRKATWSLTLAVIIFTLFFAVVIILLDTAFQYLFKEVILT